MNHAPNCTIDLEGLDMQCPRCVALENQWRNTMEEMELDAYFAHVNRDTSRERAQRESTDGTFNLRKQQVLELLREQDHTWRELANKLNLHHGQISGLLSILHKHGHIVMLKSRRDRCHPYTHIDNTRWLMPDEYWVEPVQTKTTRRLNTADQLAETVAQFLNRNANTNDLVQALETYWKENQ